MSDTYDPFYDAHEAAIAEHHAALLQQFREIIDGLQNICSGRREALDHLAEVIQQERAKIPKRTRQKSPASHMLDIMLLSAHDGADKGTKGKAIAAIGERHKRSPETTLKRLQRARRRDRDK